ncbi:OTU domain-containing protein [Legionella sp. CNM-4043-24]|uniref:OTU domain-containing protein n=1 Tax=Legionella sp. CNM-4043-24 TaxID=3421646 RepID=UPI00403AB01A
MPVKLKYYREAANNNLAYVSRKLLKHPDILDAPNPLEDSQTLYHSSASIGKTLGWAGASMVGVILMPPLAIFTTIAGGYKMVTTSSDADKRIRSRKNWTMLDYAAEYGASDVAVYLIMQGAQTGDGYFRRVAQCYGHEAFIIACDKAIARKQEMDGRLTQAQNDVALFREVNEQLLLKLISFKNKFTRLKVDYLVLYEKTLELLGEHDESSVCDLYENLKKQHEKILKLHDTLGFVSSMQKSNNPATKAFAVKLYKTLSDDYNQIVADYKKATEDYQKASENPAEAAKAQTAQTQRFFSRKPDQAALFKYAFGLQDRKVPFTDGNCFFDAVIAQAPAKAWTVGDLRDAIALELINNDGIYSPAFCGEYPEEGTMKIGDDYYSYKGYEEFCALITIDRCYVDDIHIQAFCETQKICCAIVHANLKQVILQGDKYLSDTNPPVFIGYEGNNHYVALNLPAGKTWKGMLKTMTQEGTVTLYDLEPDAFQMKL